MPDAASTPSFWRELFVVGPHAGAHRVAARAGLSACLPLLVLVSTGHLTWAAYAVFGAFTSLYGRSVHHAHRVAMQFSAAVMLVGVVTGGTATALLPHQQWWVIVGGLVVTLVAVVSSWVFDWHPSGPLYPVFGYAVCAMLPTTSHDLAAAVVVSAASAAFAVLVGGAGFLREPRALNASAIPLPRHPSIVLRRPGASRELLQDGLIVALAGSAGTLIGPTRPHWAMVAAVAAASGPTMRARFTRSVHRFLGTLLGVGLAGMLLPLHPSGLAAVLVIVVMQVGTELFSGRNYALSVLCITPLALMLGQVRHPMPVPQLLTDRFVETLLGCASSLVVLGAACLPRRTLHP